MAPYHNNNNNHSVSFEDDSPTTPDLMNGGPVGSFDGEYVNGHSTNGTNSPSTPGFHQNNHAVAPPKKKLFSTEDVDIPEQSSYLSANQADTWPRCDSPPPAAAAELGPKTRARAANGGRHASHPVPPPGPHEGGIGGPRSRTYARAKASDEDNARCQYPRISRPVELLRSSYDCVVIGSGYGGAVAASRAARAGEEVCVLELGKERWPGEYPVDAGSALEDLHFSGDLSARGNFSGINVNAGDPTGMYHLIFGKGQNAVVCNGEWCFLQKEVTSG